MIFTHYRPQQSCKGYVFTLVCLSTGVSASVHAGIPPPEQTPPGTPLGPGTPPGTRHPPCSRQLLLRTVRILLECILVLLCVWFCNSNNSWNLFGKKFQLFINIIGTNINHWNQLLVVTELVENATRCAQDVVTEGVCTHLSDEFVRHVNASSVRVRK